MALMRAPWKRRPGVASAGLQLSTRKAQFWVFFGMLNSQHPFAGLSESIAAEQLYHEGYRIVDGGLVRAQAETVETQD